MSHSQVDGYRNTLIAAQIVRDAQPYDQVSYYFQLNALAVAMINAAERMTTNDAQLVALLLEVLNSLPDRYRWEISREKYKQAEKKFGSIARD